MCQSLLWPGLELELHGSDYYGDKVLWWEICKDILNIIFCRINTARVRMNNESPVCNYNYMHIILCIYSIICINERSRILIKNEQHDKSWGSRTSSHPNHAAHAWNLSRHSNQKSHPLRWDLSMINIFFMCFLVNFVVLLAMHVLKQGVIFLWSLSMGHCP